METNITEQINSELNTSIEGMKEALTELANVIRKLRNHNFDIEAITGDYYTKELYEVIEDIAGDYNHLQGLVEQAEDEIKGDDSLCSLLVSNDGEEIIEEMRKENEEFYYSLGSYQALWEYLEDYDYLAIPPDIEEYWERLEAKAIHNDWKRG